MAELILLNGPPAAGKSTLATELVAVRPLALSLDVDVVRGLLGQWMEHPNDAGLAARRLAVAMASTHLAQGLDVIVPQFLAREEFIVELEDLASKAGARFIEVALVVGRADALDAFARRSAAAAIGQHRDAAEMVERAGGVAAVADMYDRFVAFIETRPHARLVNVVLGEVHATVRLLEAAIAR